MSGLRSLDGRSGIRIFLTSHPEPCPYLPNRTEQKLATHLYPENEADFAELTNRGFRRNHDVAYRPACPTCKACKSIRLCVADFRPNKTQRRLLRRYADLDLSLEEKALNNEHWTLFHDYIKGRHSTGSMAAMTQGDFIAMVTDSPVKTNLLTWREGPGGPLRAACLTDVLPNGLSAVYSYFSLHPTTPSLGTYVILALIELAKRAEMDFVHLGYWVKGSKTMDYKARFHPTQIYEEGIWRDLPKWDAQV